MWIFLGVSNGVSRARWVKLANRRAGHLSSLSLIRTWRCSTGILLCEAGRLPPKTGNARDKGAAVLAFMLSMVQDCSQ